MMWTLIALVMIQGWQPSQVVVPGFGSKDACIAAANAYLDALNDKSEPSRVVFRSTCIPMESK